MAPIDPRQLDCLRDPLARWGRLWDLPGLDGRVELRASTRLRRSLGHYRATRGEITIASWLLDGPEPPLEEVLCHEAAHAAVHLVHGTHVRPHGREWRGFMQQAGFAPRVRIPLEALPAARRAVLEGGDVWLHRCPVCHASRAARTRVARWRCGRCRAAGRRGVLVVERWAGALGRALGAVTGGAGRKSGAAPDPSPR